MSLKINDEEVLATPYRRVFPDFEDKTFILPLEVSYRNFVAKNGKVFKSVHPPEVNLSLKINDEEVLATPYRKSNNVEAVVEQNNFSFWVV